MAIPDSNTKKTPCTSGIEMGEGVFCAELRIELIK